jgi:hypothetical protein
MQLTTSQIDQLFTFTRQHYVEWYDLQSELVDHLANSIEAQWEQFLNEHLRLLNIEFKNLVYLWTLLKNGRLFSAKKYNSIVWKHFKDFLVFENYFNSSDDISYVLNKK